MSSHQDKRKKLNPIVCNICSVTFPNEVSRDVHFKGKKHKFRRWQKSCEIIVTNLPKHFCRRDIKKFFEKFGKIMQCIFSPNNNYIIFKYRCKENVDLLLLKEKIIYEGSYLKIESALYVNKESVIVDESDKEFKALLNALSYHTSFVGELETFMNFVTPKTDDKYYRGLNQLCNDLRHLLQSKFSNCQIQTFGSVVTGLNFKNSDVDLYVKVDACNLSQANLITDTRSLIVNDKSNSFSIIKALTKCTVPIITCTHIPTNINCDINFKNALAVNNSRFIKYFLSLNKNFLPTALVLKYWAKLNKLVLASGGFSSYSLTMMLIFVIQNLDRNYPTVCSLQSNEACNIYEDGWNCGFEEKPFTQSDDYSVIELLQRFYEYYIDFEYNQYAMCPYIGAIILKSDMQDTEKLVGEFDLYKKYILSGQKLENLESIMYFQDPFEQSRNICKAVSLKLLQKFVTECSISYQILINHCSLRELLRGLNIAEAEEPAKSVSVDNVQKCIDNMILKTKNGEIKEIKSESTAETHRSSSNEQNAKFVIDMKNCNEYLTWRIAEDKLSNEDGTEMKLCFTMFQDFFRLVLKDILKLHINEERTLCHVSASTTNDSNLHSMNIRCTGTEDVIAGRRKAYMKVKYPENLRTTLEKERFMSNLIHNPSMKIQYAVEFNVVLLTNQKQIEVEIRKKKRFKGCFESFCTFLIKNIPLWFYLHRHELNEEAKKKLTCMI